MPLSLLGPNFRKIKGIRGGPGGLNGKPKSGELGLRRRKPPVIEPLERFAPACLYEEQVGVPERSSGHRISGFPPRHDSKFRGENIKSCKVVEILESAVSGKFTRGKS